MKTLITAIVVSVAATSAMASDAFDASWSKSEVKAMSAGEIKSKHNQLLDLKNKYQAWNNDKKAQIASLNSKLDSVQDKLVALGEIGGAGEVSAPAHTETFTAKTVNQTTAMLAFDNLTEEAKAELGFDPETQTFVDNFSILTMTVQLSNGDYLQSDNDLFVVAEKDNGFGGTYTVDKGIGIKGEFPSFLTKSEVVQLQPTLKKIASTVADAAYDKGYEDGYKDGYQDGWDAHAAAVSAVID